MNLNLGHLEVLSNDEFLIFKFLRHTIKYKDLSIVLDLQFLEMNSRIRQAIFSTVFIHLIVYRP